ncbi:MAG: hypothetical protein JSU70_02995, partial [Phycisphaerales bacterium]
YWSKAPIDREQIALFAPTLDSWIPPDHPVRIFDEVLAAWVGLYCHLHPFALSLMDSPDSLRLHPGLGAVP